MLWQDLIFVFGSLLTVVALVPVVRDLDSRVPLVTSLPKMGLGLVYTLTFASLGMTLAAAAVFGTAVMWSLIAVYRAPGGRLCTFGDRFGRSSQARSRAAEQPAEQERTQF